MDNPKKAVVANSFSIIFTIFSPLLHYGVLLFTISNLSNILYYVYVEESQICANTINLVPSKRLKKKDSKERLRLTEFLLILSAVGVVVFLVLLYINPSKEAAQARNLQRSADTATILSYVSSYFDSEKVIPEQIPNSKNCVEFRNEICKSGPYNCKDLVNMSFLTKENAETLVSMPTDPLHVSINGTGYFISNEGEGKITVCAPYAERNEKISFFKYMY